MPDDVTGPGGAGLAIGAMDPTEGRPRRALGDPRDAAGDGGRIRRGRAVDRDGARDGVEMPTGASGCSPPRAWTPAAPVGRRPRPGRSPAPGCGARLRGSVVRAWGAGAGSHVADRTAAAPPDVSTPTVTAVDTTRAETFGAAAAPVAAPVGVEATAVSTAGADAAALPTAGAEETAVSTAGADATALTAAVAETTAVSTPGAETPAVTAPGTEVVAAATTCAATVAAAAAPPSPVPLAFAAGTATSATTTPISANTPAGARTTAGSNPNLVLNLFPGCPTPITSPPPHRTIPPDRLMLIGTIGSIPLGRGAWDRV